MVLLSAKQTKNALVPASETAWVMLNLSGQTEHNLFVLLSPKESTMKFRNKIILASLLFFSWGQTMLPWDSNAARDARLVRERPLAICCRRPLFSAQVSSFPRVKKKHPFTSFVTDCFPGRTSESCMPSKLRSSSGVSAFSHSLKMWTAGDPTRPGSRSRRPQ